MRAMVRAAVAALALVCGAAGAALEQRDSRFGAGTLVHDTVTGMDWLRVDLTYGMSQLDLWPAFDAGDQFEGFRFATTGEFDTLITQYAKGATDPNQSAETIQRTLDFATIFGGVDGTFGDGRYRFGVEGIIGVPFDCSAPGMDCLVQAGGALVLDWYDGTIHADTYNDAIGAYSRPSQREFTSPTLGAWLVVNPVPEPSTYALMLVGLLILMAKRRHHAV